MLSKILKIMTPMPLMRKKKHCKLVPVLLWIKVFFYKSYFPTGVKLAVFSSVADKVPTKNIFFFQKSFCVLLCKASFASVIKDYKSKRSHKILGIKVFLLLLYLLMKRSGFGSRSGPYNYGSGRSKNIWILRIRIHNTALNSATMPVIREAITTYFLYAGLLWQGSVSDSKSNKQKTFFKISFLLASWEGQWRK